MDGLNDLINDELTKHNDVQQSDIKPMIPIDSLNELNRKYHAMHSIIQLSKDNKVNNTLQRDDNLHEDHNKQISITPDLPVKEGTVPTPQDSTKLFRAISTASNIVKKSNTSDEETDAETLLSEEEHVELETKVETLIKSEKIKFPTKENIVDYLNDSTNPEQSLIITHQTFQTILAGLEETPGAYKKYVAYAFFQYAGQNLWFLHKEPLFALLVKIYFHNFIADQRFIEFVPLYNVIFNDHMYDNTSDVTVFPKIIPKEFIDKKITEYQEECKRIEYKRRAKRQPPKYEKGEIVGAKDKEGRWWMSRVLEVFHYMEHIAYYVEFLGWGEKFNEFITDGFRIETFKPRKHLYYRPAWRIRNTLNETKEEISEETKEDIK